LSQFNSVGSNFAIINRTDHTCTYTVTSLLEVNPIESATLTGGGVNVELRDLGSDGGMLTVPDGVSHLYMSLIDTQNFVGLIDPERYFDLVAPPGGTAGYFTPGGSITFPE